MKVELEDKDQLVEKSLRELIFAKAIDMIISELTPDRLKEFAIGWLEKSLEYGFDSYAARKPLQEHADAYLKKYAMLPENLERVEEAVRLGFEKIISDLPAAVYEAHKERVLEAFVPEKRR